MTPDPKTTIRSAEILSVGTELLLGEIVDTNSAYLADDLSKRGVDMYWSQRVGDNMERIQTGIRQALRRSDLLILSGGLGPTDDDMTREAIAAVLDETPVVNASLENDLREKFARFSRSMPERNLKQAWLIPSAQTLANPVGTAPGWLVRTVVSGKTRTLITLPGPPRELKRMWTEEALPQLSLPASALFTRTFKTLGLGESGIADLLGELTLGANPSVATYAKKDGVHVRVAAKADSARAAEETARDVTAQVTELLKNLTWGNDEDELVDLIHTSLAAKDLTLATLETFTGGLLSQTLSSGKVKASQYAGGVLAYNMQVFPALNLDRQVLAPENASEASAVLMAEAASAFLQADIALAVHSRSVRGESREVFLALHTPGGAVARQFSLPKLQPAWQRERATYAALSLLQNELAT